MMEILNDNQWFVKYYVVSFPKLKFVQLLLIDLNSHAASHYLLENENENWDLEEIT
jgi:hypothetical protein